MILPLWTLAVGSLQRTMIGNRSGKGEWIVVLWEMNKRIDEFVWRRSTIFTDFWVIAESKWMCCTMTLETDEFTAHVKDRRETLNMLGELKSHVNSWVMALETDEH